MFRYIMNFNTYLLMFGVLILPLYGNCLFLVLL